MHYGNMLCFNSIACLCFRVSVWRPGPHLFDWTLTFASVEPKKGHQENTVHLRWQCTIPLMGELQSAPDAPVVIHFDTWLDFSLPLSANYRPNSEAVAHRQRTEGEAGGRPPGHAARQPSCLRGGKRQPLAKCPTWRRRMNCGKRWMGFTIRP